VSPVSSVMLYLCSDAHIYLTLHHLSAALKLLSRSILFVTALQLESILIAERAH